MVREGERGSKSQYLGTMVNTYMNIWLSISDNHAQGQRHLATMPANYFVRTQQGVYVAQISLECIYFDQPASMAGRGIY